MIIAEKTIERILIELGNEQKAPFLERCVRAVASRWNKVDGLESEFEAFCLKHYVADTALKGVLLHKVLEKIEKMNGLSLSIYWSNAWSVMMQTGDIEPVDSLFAEIDPSAHLLDDFYKSKLAFFILLNFPLLTYHEKQKLTVHPGDRLQLAMSRLAELYQFRIPFNVSKKLSSAVSETYQYLSYVKFDLNRVFTSDKEPFIPHTMQVDCHWGLRDQINLQYHHKNSLSSQKTLAKIWERAILEEVPVGYYENKEMRWEPETNQLYEHDKNKPISSELFHQGRYDLLKRLFEAKNAEDVYSPELPNFIQRTFEMSREFSEQDCRKQVIAFLENPLLPQCAEKLKKILNRDLCAFDVIFNQFGLLNQDHVGEYDAIVAQKYPELSNFQHAIPDILVRLGFEQTLAQSIAKQIHVVQCRSGGFASFPKMRGGEYILTVSAHDEKMDYMAFVTAMHELGHCVERYLSSEFIDYYTLGEVPGDAFTEAFAFLFDEKCLELLDIEGKSDEHDRTKILNLFWTAYLNCGLALVDMECWRWMYAHPGFSVNELKAAVIKIARDTWNQYYAPIFSEKDSVILAGYSPMFINPLYMPEYAMAIFIQTQLTHYLKDKVLGQEMPRMCGIGKLTPDAWMMNAVGSPISSHVLLILTESVL